MEVNYIAPEQGAEEEEDQQSGPAQQNQPDSVETGGTMEVNRDTPQPGDEEADQQSSPAQQNQPDSEETEGKMEADEQGEDSEEQAKPKRSFEFPGKRGTIYGDGNGYFYVADKLRKGRRYLKCMNLGSCKARAIMDAQDEAPIIPSRESPSHNHEEDHSLIAVREVMDRLKERAMYDRGFPLKEIFEDETSRNPDITFVIAKIKTIRMMQRVRRGDMALEVSRSDARPRRTRDDGDNAMEENEDEDEQPGSPKPKRSFEFQGRRGTIYGDGNGYFYIADTVRNTRRYMKCIKQNTCKARAIMANQDGAPIIPSLGSPLHNHEADHDLVATNEFMARLKDRAMNDRGVPLAEILEDETSRNPDIALKISKSNALRIMQRVRHVELPEIPCTLEEAREAILGNPRLQRTRDDGDNFFLEEEIGKTGSLGFVSRRTVEYFSNHPAEANELFIDSTFKVVPRQLGLKQLLSVHVLYMNVTFPVAFFLMPTATSASYSEILTYVRNNVITWVVTHITTDFERTLALSVRDVFPEAEVHGCWFHYCQAIWRTVVTFGLKKACQEDGRMMEVIRMIMSLPHLPPQRGAAGLDSPPYSIADGIESVRYFIDQEHLDERLHVVLDYMCRFWMKRIPADQLTTFARPRRSNHGLENFHSRLLAFFGTDPNLWQFIEYLQRVEQTFYCDLRRVEVGVGIRKVQIGRAYDKNASAIREAMRLLIRGEVNLVDFLRRAAFSVNNLLNLFEHPLRTLQDEQLEDVVALGEPQEPFNEQAAVDVAPMQMGPPPPIAPSSAAPLYAPAPAPFARPHAPSPQHTLAPFARPHAPTPQHVPAPAPFARPHAPRPAAPARPRKRGQRGGGSRLCSICNERRTTHAAIPCGHKCLCPQCAADQMRLDARWCQQCGALCNNYIKIL